MDYSNMGQMDPKSLNCFPTPEPLSPRAVLGVNPAPPVWELIRPTLHHDLPNLLVALQGLLEILRQEESPRLSQTGRDYLQRLFGVAQKLQNTLTTLRFISKASSSVGLPETIRLPELFREVAATCKHMFPQVQVNFQLFLQVTQVQAPSSLLSQALVELVHLLGIGSGLEDFPCQVFSRAGLEEVELLLGVGAHGVVCPPPDEVGATKPPAFSRSRAGSVDYNFFGPDQRLSVVLVEELLHSVNGRLEILETPGPWKWVRILLRDELHLQSQLPAVVGHRGKSVDQ